MPWLVGNISCVMMDYDGYRLDQSKLPKPFIEFILVLDETEWPVSSAQGCLYHGKAFSIIFS